MITLPHVLCMEGLPVHIIIHTTIIAVPLIVIDCAFVMDRAVPPSILVGVGHIAASLVITLGVGVGTVLVVMVVCATPEAILQSRTLEVLVVRVELLTFAAVDGVRERAAVGVVAWGGFVMKLGLVEDMYVMLQAQLSGDI